jgi:hypothetical protein
VKLAIEACQAKISEPSLMKKNRQGSGNFGRYSPHEAGKDRPQLTPFSRCAQRPHRADRLSPVESPNSVRRGFCGDRCGGLLCRIFSPKYEDTTAQRLARRKSFHCSAKRSSPSVFSAHQARRPIAVRRTAFLHSKSHSSVCKKADVLWRLRSRLFRVQAAHS